MDRYLIKKQKTNEMSSESVNKDISQPQPSTTSTNTISVQKNIFNASQHTGVESDDSSDDEVSKLMNVNQDNIESDSDRCLTPEYKRIKRGEAKYPKHRKQI
uniref:Uncharacterized protein n=1 Tax=Schizaphis graminum TaxID=13262 RepID=A0A2S2PS95_SCHGA